MDIFDELNKAIESGNQDEIDRVRRKILLVDRDETIDENYVKSIKGKTLYKNMVKAVSESDDVSYNDYAKLVTSMITHCIIEAQTTNNDIKSYPVQELYVILGGFINESEDKVKAVKRTREFIEDRYKKFF